MSCEIRSRLLLACMVSSALLLLTASISHAQDADEAQGHYARGTSLYQNAAYQEALEQFRLAIALRDSPNARLASARCLRALGRLAEAVSEYERTIARAEALASEAGAYAQTRDVARAELAAIEPHVGRVRISLSPSPREARVRLNGRELTSAEREASIPVAPGTLEVVVEAAGFAPARARASVDASREVTVPLVLMRRSTEHAERTAVPSPSPSPSRSGAHDDRGASRSLHDYWWVALGVGIAASAAFGILYVLADHRNAVLRRDCIDLVCDDDRFGELRDGGRALELSANISLGVGIAGIAAAAVLLLLPDTEGNGDGG